MGMWAAFGGGQHCEWAGGEHGGWAGGEHSPIRVAGWLKGGVHRARCTALARLQALDEVVPAVAEEKNAQGGFWVLRPDSGWGRQSCGSMPVDLFSGGSRHPCLLPYL